MRRNTLNSIQILMVSILLVLTDQISKHLARNYLIFGNEYSFLPGIIQLRLVSNKGAAFSIFNNATPFLALLSLVVAAFLFFWILGSAPFNFWKGLGLGFLLSGAIGNGIDRFRLGYVTDFLQIIPFNFPIFNFADITINIALTFFLIDSLTARNKQKNIH